jgi:hypothetical protein
MTNIIDDDFDLEEVSSIEDIIALKKKFEEQGYRCDIDENHISYETMLTVWEIGKIKKIVKQYLFLEQKAELSIEVINLSFIDFSNQLKKDRQNETFRVQRYCSVDPSAIGYTIVIDNTSMFYICNSKLIPFPSWIFLENGTFIDEKGIIIL